MNKKEIEKITTEYEDTIDMIIATKAEDPKYKDLIAEHEQLKAASIAGLQAAGAGYDGSAEVDEATQAKVREAFQMGTRVGALENRLLEIYEAEG